MEKITKTLSSLTDVLFFDVETSTHNKGHPFDARNFLVSYAYLFDGTCDFKYYTDPDFIESISQRLGSCSVIVGFNIKFDIHWLRNIGIVLPPHVKVWDCQLAEFILSGQEARFASLADTLRSYGLQEKKAHLVEDYWAAGISTENIPVPVLREYNVGDIEPLKELFKAQLNVLTEKQQKLVWLEGEDLKALQDAEYNGVKFDVDKAKAKLDALGHDLSGINTRLRDYLPADCRPEWFNWDSGDHLSALLYGGEIEFTYVSQVLTYKTGSRMGQSYNRYGTSIVTFPQRFRPIEGSIVKKCSDPLYVGTKFYQTDGPSLSQLKTRKAEDRTLLELLKQRADKTKVAEMITSIMNKMADMHWKDNYIHGQFNQNVVITGRLSSSGPNLQNTPVEVDELLVSRYDDN